jgi:hypothetical protein
MKSFIDPEQTIYQQIIAVLGFSPLINHVLFALAVSVGLMALFASRSGARLLLAMSCFLALCMRLYDLASLYIPAALGGRRHHRAFVCADRDRGYTSRPARPCGGDSAGQRHPSFLSSQCLLFIVAGPLATAQRISPRAKGHHKVSFDE